VTLDAADGEMTISLIYPRTTARDHRRREGWSSVSLAAACCNASFERLFFAAPRRVHFICKTGAAENDLIAENIETFAGTISKAGRLDSISSLYLAV